MKELNIEEHYYRHLNLTSGDLRISIVDFCNMKCDYCHNEGQKNNYSQLTVSEILYIVKYSLKYGVNKVRLTGGEPLLHKDIETICSKLRHEVGISNLGINTNGIEYEKLKNLYCLGLLDQIVIGVDYFNAPISKKSPIGKSSFEILNNAKQLKVMGANVQIATVFTDDYYDLEKMIEWCFENNILLKILEQTGGIATSFYEMINKVVQKYKLKVGITADLNELYAFNEKGNKILFFQSHCNRKECDICKNLHMRVTSAGFAKPCLLREDTSFSLFDNYDYAMKRALANLGNGPGSPCK